MLRFTDVVIHLALDITALVVLTSALLEKFQISRPRSTMPANLPTAELISSIWRHSKQHKVLTTFEEEKVPGVVVIS